MPCGMGQATFITGDHSSATDLELHIAFKLSVCNFLVYM